MRYPLGPFAEVLMRRTWLLLPALVTSCGGEPNPKGDRSVAAITPGAPIAGMAEAYLDYPVGAPLGGYTGRCNCFGNAGEVDKRQSAYIENFNPSAGVHMQPKAVALWLENGQQDLVMIRFDAIYSFDKLTRDLGDRLSEESGHDLRGKVTLSANHSHNAPANYNDGVTWYLGGDRFNEEVYERLLESLVDVSMEAFDSRVPAAIGIGQAKDWDPENKVYHDRRDQNDNLGFFSDIPPGPYKDPYLTILRVDTAAGAPIGFFFAFGMHGTVLGGDNEMWSSDASGGVEAAVEEQFDQPIIAGYLQHGGGDASPSGTDEGFANIESLGEYAAPTIVDLWSRTPTSSAPIRLDTVTHGIDTSRDNIAVTRGGTLDLRYAPYVEGQLPDDVIYGASGEILSPIDEFNTSTGGAFCGEDFPLIPGVSIGSDVQPYSSCIEVGVIANVIRAFFDLEEDEMIVPLPESLRATVSASRIGPLPILQDDGTEVTDDVLLAFFPGEVTALYTEQFRRRAKAELGIDHAIPFGYSQDHEGYLLIPEDWLLGGYESSINIWGPLQAEHIMEGVLELTEKWLMNDVIEPEDPWGDYPSTAYAERALPTDAPDATPLAGTLVEATPEYLYQPLPGLTVELQPAAVLPRVQGIAQLVWEGGDPGVDLPDVRVERLEGDAWVELTTAAGRELNTASADILVAHTPDPLYPWDDPQSHAWWAAWQVVDHVRDRAGLPTGTYRLHVYGKSYAGGSTTWPWATTDYELTSEPFEVVPATLTLTWDGVSLGASLPGPSAGYRLIDKDGASKGNNPVHEATITWTLDDGTTESAAPEATVSGGVSWFTPTVPQGVVVSIDVVDQYGNAGHIDL